MARYCYLFDASALVALLLRSPAEDAIVAKQKLSKLIAVRRTKDGPAFFVPDICMAECSSALAKIFLGSGYSEKKEAAYRQHIESLLDWVSSNKKHVIQTYKLERDHFVDIENIFISDRRLPLRKGSPLSGHDGIIIAMGIALPAFNQYSNVIILTTDGRIVDVCKSDPNFPHAIDLAKQEIPGI